ncbi:MAG: aminotransferase class I/II-fold pyridoxal phosphate-dependent enzyme [Anaerolineae bacterium]|nr:aminotransferase class I/II-fold pyridoxal phosphate-dependent enzyme [Anaerolineae bacterium]
MTFQLAERIRDLEDYPFVKISDDVRRLQQAGVDVIRLDMGSPDMPPPPVVKEALCHYTSQDDQHGYTGYRGSARFRQAVARYYQRLFDVHLNADTEILPLLGSKEGLVNMALAVISPGDISLMTGLGYPPYIMGTKIAGGEIYEIPAPEENRFFPILEAVPTEIAKRARLLWLNYPNNPTGALATLEDYANAVEFCRRHNILLISDNPYFEVVFDGQDVAASVLQVPGAKDVAVEFMSLSKSHNMAGWRLGACVGNAEAVAALLRVKSNVDSGHFNPVYEAGIAALDHTPREWIQERNAIYQERRDMLIEAMPMMRLTLKTIPKGALYIWAIVPDGNDVAYCEGALNEAGVSITPGSVYGADGKGYVRFSLVTPQERLAEAIARIQKWQTRL